MLATLTLPFRLLRLAVLKVRLYSLEYDADMLEARMLSAPVHLAELRSRITDMRNELEALQ